MGYRGVIIPIPVAQQGLETDISQTLQPPVSLTMAQNVTCRYGNIEKDPGSYRWNPTPMPGSVLGLSDWWPDDENQRVIAACDDGNLYRFLTAYSSAPMVVGGAPDKMNFSDQTFMVQGGSESLGRNRKLFIISGNDPIQVIDGDSSIRRPMNAPAADWKDNPPKAGLVHNQGFWVWGNTNNPHTLYRSSLSDHEDFTTTTPAVLFQLVDVFPGDGDGIKCCFTWKGRLYVLKYPFGLYFVDDSNVAAPTVQKLSASFGAASEHAAIQALDDILVGNSTGSISSLRAVFSLGETEQGDILKSLRCVKLVQNNANSVAPGVRQAVYYENKKQALFVYRSTSGQKNDRILVIDNHDTIPKVTFIDKDQPTCLSLIRDSKRIPTPFYGAEDGYIYKTDSANRTILGDSHNENGSGFTGTFQTPFLDFGWVNPEFKDHDKIFDFIGLTFVPQGNWNISADIFIDDRFLETVQLSMARNRHMSGNFPLDHTILGGIAPISRFTKIHGFGKRISARFYNSVAGQNFKISDVIFYFRLAGTKNR